MNPWLSAGAGALAGHVILALTAAWVLNACLPFSAGESKWQCDVSVWAIAAGYFAVAFTTAFLARRWKLAMALLAFLVVLAGHSVIPDLAIISLRRGLRLHEHALYFAALPAVLGLVAALLSARRRPAG
jgi:hypothetical protein